MEKMNPGLYIHVPFCMSKCSYCSFYSVGDTDLMDGYVNALISEIALTRGEGWLFDTVYFGGGTPSLLSPFQLERVMEALESRFEISPESEITMEANPGTVSLEKLSSFRGLGVNRLNFGVQSFCDETLKFLGRIHTRDEAFKALSWAREAGFENLGLDVIYGIPGQTREKVTEDLQAAMDLSPEHISSYLLSFEEGTTLHDSLCKGKVKELSDRESASLVDHVINTFTAGGYLHYEVSNYAREEKYRSRHNRKYWSPVTYLGFGPSAHSFISENRFRYWNFSGIEKYIASLGKGDLPVDGSESLTKEQEMIEMIYLGLRTTSGINTKVFDERFDVSFSDLFGDLVERLSGDGLIRLKGPWCRLTRDGFRLLDGISERFVAML